MNSHSLVKSGRPPAGNAASTMSDATALAIERSKQQFTADMRKLLNEAKRYFGDVSWRLDGDDEVIYGHRGKKAMELRCILYIQYLTQLTSNLHLSNRVLSQQYCMHEQMRHFSLDSSIRMAALVCKLLCLGPLSRYRRHRRQ